MAVATVTKKGQVTIPQIIRDTLGLHIGDRIEFVIDDAGGAVIRLVIKKVDEIYACCIKPAGKLSPLTK